MKDEYLKWIEYCVEQHIKTNKLLGYKDGHEISFSLKYNDGSFKLDIKKEDTTELYRGVFSILALSAKIELIFHNIKEIWEIKI